MNSPRHRLSSAALALTIGSASALSAQSVWTVDDSGGADFTDLQAAVDAASSGDVLLVAAGVYGNVAVLGKGLTILGDGAAPSVRQLVARDLPSGEELVLILPNTPRSAAAATAESIRRAIASRPVKIGEPTVPTLAITASVGVASYEPGSPFKEPAHLVKAADLAVYAAKRSGRNCVRVFSANKSAAPGANPTSPAGEAA